MSDSPKAIDDIDRSQWDTAYWAGRDEIDDEDGHVIEKLRVTPDGEDAMPDDVQEITGGEITEPEPTERLEEISEYSEDWAEVSDRRRTECSWRCEECWFVLISSPVIHVHHVNRDKSDNSKGNLQVLCLTCHGKKHGGGKGMGEWVPPEHRAKLDAWHRNVVSRLRDRRLIDAKLKSE